MKYVQQLQFWWRPNFLYSLGTAAFYQEKLKTIRGQTIINTKLKKFTCSSSLVTYKSIASETVVYLTCTQLGFDSQILHGRSKPRKIMRKWKHIFMLLSILTQHVEILQTLDNNNSKNKQVNKLNKKNSWEGKAKERSEN